MSRPSPYAPDRTLRSRPSGRYAVLLFLALVAILAALPTSSPAHAGDGAEPPDKPTGLKVPAKPTGLEVSTEAGSLDVTVDWNDTPGADSYEVRWREGVRGTQLNEPVSVTTSKAEITVADYGEWVVKVSACNEAGCGPGQPTRFHVETAPDAHAHA